MKKMLMALLSAVMVVGLAACGNGGEQAGNDAATSEAGGAANANYASVMLSTNVMSLDTNLATDGESFEVIADVTDGLLQLDKDGAPIPAIAESYDVSEDGLTYTFHLRDAKWSNGDPVTANDFLFAWRRIAKENGEYAYMLGDGVGNIKNADAVREGADPSTLGVSAPDDKTFVVELSVPVSFFPSLMAFPVFYPINEKFYTAQAEGTYGTSPETYLSNGAFLLESYTPGTANLVLKKNPDYWDAERVKLAGLNYQVVGSSDNALTAFKNNTLDLVTISGNQVANAQADSAIGNKIKITGAGYLWYLTFSQTEKNAEGGMLANKNLRLAMSNAIDRDSIVNNFVMDGSLPTFTAVPPQFANNAENGEDFSADQKRYSDVVGFDTARAQEYYAKAKQELGKESFNFTLIYGNNEGDEVAKIAQALKSQIEAALPGMTINLQAMTKSERLDKMQNDNYDVALTRWGPDYADPLTYLGMWTTGNSNNYGFWSNADYDKLIQDATVGAFVSDYQGRWNALHEAEKLVMNDAVIAPLFTKSNANLINPALSGVEFHPVALNRVYKNAVKGN